MEIRILQKEELGNAAGLCRFVFDNTLRNRILFPQTISFVESYLQIEHIEQLYQEQKLKVWGAFEEEQLLAVSGLQSDALVTMLYVLPQFANRGIGSALLRTMRIYAKEYDGMEKILLNAMPAWTALYFEKQGFSYLQPKPDMRAPFVPMYAWTNESLSPMKRHIPKRYILLAAVGCVLLATAATWLFMMWYL